MKILTNTLGTLTVAILATGLLASEAPAQVHYPQPQVYQVHPKNPQRGYPYYNHNTYQYRTYQYRTDPYLNNNANRYYRYRYDNRNHPNYRDYRYDDRYYYDDYRYRRYDNDADLRIGPLRIDL